MRFQADEKKKVMKKQKKKFLKKKCIQNFAGKLAEFQNAISLRYSQTCPRGWQ
jgi:hypothetical protein